MRGRPLGGPRRPRLGAGRRALSGAAALATLLALGAAWPTRARGEERAGRPEDAVTLTVSGGVSLGAYEAGLTWALVQYLKALRGGAGAPAALLRPRLAAVTGASAGAVNAFLAAALWCERPGLDAGVDQNLLLDAWLDLDLAELLPRNAGGYAPGDGLLAAAPLERTGRRLREAIFGSGAAGRFVPGCRVPVGISVTPFVPLQRDVAGLTTQTQRMVIPWLFEIGADGAAVVHRQPIRKGELAESVLDLAGIPGPGEAGPFRHEVVEQALLASAAVPVALAPRRLCTPAPPAEDGASGPAESCADYVDGGVFDNAPMGLAVDLVEGTGGGSVLHPIISFLVDPERRRLQPPPAPQPEGDHATLGRQLRLFGDLLATARSAELSRAIRSRGWNRTTQRLLREFSILTAEVAEIHATFASAAPPAPEAAPRPRAPAGGRAALGRALSACLERLERSARSGRADRCVEEIPALASSPAPGEAPLAPEEVIRLAERLTSLLRAAQARPGPPDPTLALAHQRTLQAGSSVMATTFLLLADEAGRVAASGLPEAELRRFRDAVLEPVRRAAELVQPTNVLLDGLLAEHLERLAGAAPPPVAAEARRALRRLAATPPGALFALDVLEGTAAASTDALARGRWEPAAATEAWRGVLSVVAARTRFAGVTARMAGLRQEALELGEGPATTERRLELSTRFAPLAGAQLSGFAGFLDQPFRRHDYYAGVYEAVHAIAAARCAAGPGAAGEAAPVRLASDPSEIDLSAAASQRCVGEAMRDAVEILGIRASPQGRQVFAALAGLELAAWLGRSSRALVLRGEPSWAWLDALAAPQPGAPVLVTLEALTSARIPCRPGDDAPLCLDELGFDGFIAALRAHGYRTDSQGMALVLDDPSLFWADTAQRLASRALAVERRAVGSDPGPLSRTVMASLSAGELLSRRAAARGPAPRLLLDPSTIPAGPIEGQAGWRRIAAHVLPYRLSLDVARGGFSLAWLEPELRLRRWLTLRSTLEPVGYRSDSGWTSSAGALAVVHAGPVSLGAGPRWWLDWRGGWWVGPEVRVFALQDRLGLGVGVRDAGVRDGRGWFVTVSVADLNGLAFWLSPLGAR